MISHNYYNNNHKIYGNHISFEEQLLLNYEDYLQSSTFYSLRAENDYDLELDDLNQEYDENDWEEEEEQDIDEKPEEDEESVREPGTFLM